VAREAAIMSSSAAILQELGTVCWAKGRRYYEDFPHIPDNVSYFAELRAIKAAGDAVTAVQDRVWVPQELADLTDVEVNDTLRIKQSWNSVGSGAVA
jgi:hypothetical protein